MRMRLARNAYESAAGYTLGRLFVDEGGFLCWVLEPENRGLRQDMALSQIERKKVKGKTAIPTGTYRIRLRVSPKFGDKWYAKEYGGKFPYLCDVPGFDAIMIHPGNTAPGTPGATSSDTAGCLLPGEYTKLSPGRVFNSVLAFQDLMNFYIWPAYKRGEEIWITIE